MPALASELRKTLESTVVDARDKAERGARDALTALAVAASEPYSSMSEDERKLRNRLRARGRQLGDQRDSQKGTQSIERLVREMAYEHWHRMLFARFLAENQLLIEPSSGVAITLDECEELAAEEGTDLWGMAAQFAQEMLPQIFRTDDPVLALRLPLEIRQQLQGLVAGLAIETFTASDSLGWTYQFWQTKRKKEVNDSGVKIGADELSPVTQLFTEDYMVDFLLDNTLGAWHAGKMLAANPEIASAAQTEDELRQAVALPGCPWSYLRFIKPEDDGTWAPAAGTFEGWPRTAAELQCLDPCMGSGHFVVAMFERLVALRIAEEDLNDKAAVAAVIEVNLFGLEIDPRCSQIAAFNLALAAWRRVGHYKLPAMNLACSGLAPNTRKADWLAMAGDNERLRNGMEQLYWQFEKASVLGSLINTRTAKRDLLTADFHELQPLFEKALDEEKQDEDGDEISVTARGLTKAAEILASKFTLIATNVPFLAKNEQAEILRSHIGAHYAEGAGNLAMAMLERCQSLVSTGSTAALVTIQDWMFLKLYQPLRQKLLRHQTINAIVQMGAKAFSTQMWDFNTMLIIKSNLSPSDSSRISAIDAMNLPGPKEKADELAAGLPVVTSQAQQLRNPANSIIIEDSSKTEVLGEFTDSYTGIQTGDDRRFRMKFWEIESVSQNWRFDQGTVSSSQFYGGRSGVLRWQDNGNVLRQMPGAYVRGEAAWGKRGIAVSQMNELPVTLYSGECWNMNCAVIIPKKEDHLPALWAFCSSDIFAKNVRKINQSLKVNPGYFLKTHTEFELWLDEASKRYPKGLPNQQSSDPTQWLFSGSPSGADNSLHVAVARLLGYQWPRQTGSSFAFCDALEPDKIAGIGDEDGIVCLSPIRGETAAADRLRNLLAAAFGDEWSYEKEKEIILEAAIANKSKKISSDLDGWLRQSFFAEHCKLFQSRPFVWQIWDGNPKGFSALVNYHKLAAPNSQGRKTLELLTYTYLGDWIDRQKLDQAEDINGADDRLAAALDLQGQLKKILDGEPPHDIFVRWKPLHQQTIGWDPDVNDGVRLNIRPFINAQLRKGGKAGAGILRAKPGTIKWNKDGGKELLRSKEDFPWFWGWDETNKSLATDFGAPISGTPCAGDSFDGNRWNDLHYTRAAKEAARAQHRGEG